MRPALLYLFICIVAEGCQRSTDDEQKQYLEISEVIFPDEQQAYLVKQGIISRTLFYPPHHHVFYGGLFTPNVVDDSFNSGGKMASTFDVRTISYTGNAVRYTFGGSCSQDSTFRYYYPLSKNLLMCLAGMKYQPDYTSKERFFGPETETFFVVDNAGRVTAMLEVFDEYGRGISSYYITRYRYSDSGLLLRKEQRNIYLNKSSNDYYIRKERHDIEVQSSTVYYYHRKILDSAITKRYLEGEAKPIINRLYADSSGLYRYAIYEDSMLVLYQYRLKKDIHMGEDQTTAFIKAATGLEHWFRQNRQLITSKHGHFIHTYFDWRKQ